MYLIFLSDPWWKLALWRALQERSIWGRRAADRVCRNHDHPPEVRQDFQIFGMLLRLLFFFGSISAIYHQSFQEGQPTTDNGCDFELWNTLTVVLIHCRRMRSANLWSCCIGRCWAIIRSERCTICTAWRESSAWSKLHRWKRTCRPLVDHWSMIYKKWTRGHPGVASRMSWNEWWEGSQVLWCWRDVWCNTVNQKHLSLVGTLSMSQGIGMIWLGQRHHVTSHEMMLYVTSSPSFRLFHVEKWYFDCRLNQLEVHRPITNDMTQDHWG